jgi:hypothetical protein
MPCRNLLVWVILAWGTASAQLPEQVKLQINSFPPSQVYLETATGLKFLGPSGHTLTVQPPAMLDAALRPVQYSNGFLVLKAAGHDPLRISVAGPEWSQAHLPSRGRYSLSAHNLGISLQDYLQAYPLLFAVGLGALVWLALQAFQWRRSLLSKKEENRHLQAQLRTTGDPLVGKTLGPYRVLSRLGQGGMGAVYRVQHPEGGHYAAKVVYFQSGESLELLRFRREFQVLTQLQHPALLRAFDYGEEEGCAYCICELLEGQTLDHHILPQGLGWEKIWPWVKTILEGLICAHKAGVVHRDLKPANLMVTDQGLKILDFGLARQVQITAITLTGQAYGTPTYMAPEQVSASGTEVDVRTDLYSLGVMMYELLSGQPPFQGGDVQSVIACHISAPPPPLSSRVRNLPAGLEEVVHTLLAKKPANRYQNAERVLELLSQISSTHGISERETPSETSPRGPLAQDTQPVLRKPQPP